MASFTTSHVSAVSSAAELRPTDSHSNGSIVSSADCVGQVGYGATCIHLQPPVLAPFDPSSVLLKIGPSTTLDALTLVASLLESAHKRACDAYVQAYQAYAASSSCPGHSTGNDVENGVSEPSPSPVELGTPRVYADRYDGMKSARTKGWRDGTSFGDFQFSSRGSNSTVVSSSATVYPDGKCYLALAAGGHKRSMQNILGRWPSIVKLLKVPAVKFNVLALSQMSFDITDAFRCHIVPYSGVSVMACLAGFASRNAGSLNVNSSSWEGTLLHALLGRGDYAELLDASRMFRVPVTAVVGGLFSSSSKDRKVASSALGARGVSAPGPTTNGVAAPVGSDRPVRFVGVSGAADVASRVADVCSVPSAKRTLAFVGDVETIVVSGGGSRPVADYTLRGMDESLFTMLDRYKFTAEGVVARARIYELRGKVRKEVVPFFLTRACFNDGMYCDLYNAVGLDSSLASHSSLRCAEFMRKVLGLVFARYGESALVQMLLRTGVIDKIDRYILTA